MWISSKAIVAAAIIAVYLLVWTIGSWYKVGYLYKRPICKNGNFPHNIKREPVSNDDTSARFTQAHPGDAAYKKIDRLMIK